MKKIGEFHGMSVYESPVAPDGMLYILNGKQDLVRLDIRSKRRRFIDKVRNIFKRIVK